MASQLEAARDDTESEQLAAEVNRLTDEVQLWRDLAAQRDEEIQTIKAQLVAENAARAEQLINFQTASQLQLDTIQQNETALSQLRTDLAARSEQVEALQAEQRDQTTAMAQLESQLADSKTRLAATADLESQWQVAVAEATTLREELAQLRPRLARAERDQTSLNETINSLRVRLADANSETVEAQRTASAVTGQLRTKVSDLEQQLNAAREAAVRYRAQAEAATDRDEAREVMLAQVADLESQLEEAQALVVSLQSTTAENRSLAGNIATVSADLSSALAEVQSLQEEKAQLTVRLDEQLALVATLGATADDRSNRATEFTQRIAQLEAGQRAAEQASAAARVEAETLRARLAQAEQLERELDRTQKALRQAQSQTSVGMDMTAIQAERDAAVSAATEMSQELDAAEVAINEQASRITELVAEKQSLEEDLRASQRVVDAALAAQATAATEAESNEALRSQVGGLQQQIRNYEEQMSDERASTAKEFAALTLQLQRSRETAKSLNEANRALLATREVDAENTDSRVTQLQTEATALNDQLNNLRAENMALQTALAEASSAPKPPANWQQLQTSLTREVETLTRDLRTAESYTTTVTELTGANEQLQVTVAELESRLAGATAREQQAQRRESSLQGDLEAQRVQLAALEAQLAGVAQLPEKVSGLATDLADVRAENLALQTALAEARAAPKPPAGWQQREVALNREIETLTRDLATAESYATTVTELSGANEQLQASMSQLQNRLADANGRAEQARLREETLAAEIEAEKAARANVESRLAQVSDLPDQVASMRTAMAEIRDDFETTLSENSELKAELAAAEVALNEQQASVDERSAAERLKLETELAQMTQATSTLTSQLQANQAQLADAVNARQTSVERIAILESQLANAGTLATEVQDLSRRVREAESEIATRRTTNLNLQQALTNERTRLEAQIASLQRDNRSLNGRLNQAQTTLDQIAAAARVLNPNASSTVAFPRTSLVPSAPSGESQTDGGDERFHLVVEGDSLTRISLRYYGTGSRWQEIYQANREILSESNALRPGQRLRIP